MSESTKCAREELDHITDKTKSRWEPGPGQTEYWSGPVTHVSTCRDVQ
jgi:hypothetical protein